MSVVELNRYFVRKFVPVLVVTFKASDEIAKRAGDEEIFLHETQALALAGRVVRIENPSERFGGQQLGDGANKIAMTEDLEIEIVGRSGCPEPKRGNGFNTK